MKTIIAGVDFSRSSYNAANYAAMLAEKLNYQLVLYNMYEVPLIHSNSGLYFVSDKPVRDEGQSKLEAYVKKLKKVHPDLNINSFISAGFFKQELTSFIKKHQVQYVVMGLSSKDRFSKFIYGSHSTDIAGKLNAPVIIVPDNFTKHHLHRIVLGVDNREKLHKSSLRPVENLVKGLKTDVSALHVRTEDEIFQDKGADHFTLNGKDQKIEEIPAKAIENGLQKFTRSKKADLIAIISKKHSVFYNLFYESNTKKIAFTSKIPVMAIHQ